MRARTAANHLVSRGAGVQLCPRLPFKSSARNRLERRFAAATRKWMRQPMLDLDDVQGDVLTGMQKDFENFIFFKIVHSGSFNALVKQYVVNRITSAQQVQQRDPMIKRHKRPG